MITADSGKSVTLPNKGNLARTGYIFTGWNEKSNGTGTNYNEGYSYTVSSNTTLYAKWLPVYTVTFDGNGNTGGSVPAAMNADSGKSITLPGKYSDLTKNEYIFAGWNKNSDGTETNYSADTAYMVTCDITLYAKWSDAYVVYFNSNGATSGSVPAAMEVKLTDSNKIITLPGKGDLARIGYKFTGWNEKSNGTGTNYNEGYSYTVRNIITLYAKWFPVYTVTFDGNGNTGGSVPAAVNADSGKSITLPDCGTLTRNGFNFGGWGTYQTGSSYTVTSNVTLYAVWRYTFTDSRDGKTYKAVGVGNLTWMAENLNYYTSDSWCYDNTASNCERSGRLYNWNTAKTVCPAGWSLPDRSDWRRLIETAGDSSTAGKKLKSTTGWYYSYSYYNSVGTDSFGFSALPGSLRSSYGSFNADASSQGNWWTTTESYSDYAYSQYMNYSGDYVIEKSQEKNYGLSVRCIQD